VAQNPDLARLIHTARDVNDSKPFWVVDKVKAALADCLTITGKRAADIRIACFGLAFKSNIDDLRESPAVAVTKLIADWHAGETWAVEPNVQKLPSSLATNVILKDLTTALEHADLLVMLVDHTDFKLIPSDRITQQWIIDTKGVWR